MGPDHYNKKCSFYNRVPDYSSRWWLNLQQPNYGFDKGLACAEFHALEAKVETLEVGEESDTCKGMQEAYSENSQLGDMNHMMAKNEMVEVDSVGCSKQTLDFSDYSWIEGVKPHPWWRTTDRYELACLVSQKSLNYIENCDLPPPKKKYLGRGQSCADIGDDKINIPCFDWEAESGVFSNLAVHAKGSLDSGFMLRNLRHLHFASGKSSSYTTIHEGVTEQAFEGDHSKAQLMEALCHSQTRAREAEEVAKQAYAEKEHIVALFLMQASQLLAYEQWFRLSLQLETVKNSHIKNTDRLLSTHFPEALPWRLFEGRKLQKRKQLLLVNAKREMLGKIRRDISTYAVAFALGLGLVGAGLFLGWTVGWMLPHL